MRRFFILAALGFRALFFFTVFFAVLAIYAPLEDARGVTA